MEPWGLAGDRRWMIVDREGRFVTGREAAAGSWEAAPGPGLGGRGIQAPAARAAAAGLLAHIQASDGPRPGAPNPRVSPRPQFRDILRAAPPGSIDPRVDPDDVFDMLLGAILVRTLLPAATARRQPVERIVTLIIRLLQPPGALMAAPGGAATQAEKATG